MRIRYMLAAALVAQILVAGCRVSMPTPAQTVTSAPPTPTAPLPPLSGSGGGKIVFSSRRGQGDYAVYVMNADGTDKRRLTRNRFEDEETAWSADGAKIAFNIDTYSGSCDIYVMNADGSDLRQLTTDGNSGSPAWSPDGRRIAFSRHNSDRSSELYVMNHDGSNSQQLTVTGAERVYSPAWSPDGTQMACVLSTSAEPLEEESTICVFDVEEALRKGGAGVADLRELPRPGEDVNDRPAWSPDGARIVFSALVEGHRDLYVVQADGTRLEQLTYTPEHDEFAPVWSPDGTKIAFQANPHAHWDIYVMRVDGTGLERLTTDVANDTSPDWVR